MIKKVICGGCRKGLFNISFTENGPVEYKFGQTSCPFCKDKSFEFSISGPLSIGPIGSDESAYPTTIIDTEMVSKNHFTIKVSKNESLESRFG